MGLSRPVGFCPGCGAPLDDASASGTDADTRARHAAASLVQEFWVGEDRHFLCWCAACAMLSTVVLAVSLVSHEPEH